MEFSDLSLDFIETSTASPLRCGNVTEQQPSRANLVGVGALRGLCQNHSVQNFFPTGFSASLSRTQVIVELHTPSSTIYNLVIFEILNRAMV
jgi:hypothetical protein